MGLTYREGVAVALIIFYTPVFLTAIYLLVYHGFRRGLCWLYLVIFSVARLVGSAFELRIRAQPDSIGVYEGALILQTLGLSPLTICALSLLSRVITNIRAHGHNTFVRPVWLRLIELVVAAALALAVVGGTTSYDNGVYHPATISMVASGLFVGAYAFLTLFTFLTLPNLRFASAGERRLAYALAITMPFFGVRVLYNILSTLTHIHAFNPLLGNVTALLIMTYIMEAIVVVVWISAGLMLPKDDDDRAREQLLQHASPAGVPQSNRLSGSNGRHHHDQKDFAQTNNPTEPSKSSGFLDHLFITSFIIRIFKRHNRK